MKRVALAVLILAIVAASALAGTPAATGVRVRIVFPASAHAEAITGRVYVALNRVGAPVTGRGGGGGPIQQAGPTGAPLFGLNVENLKPGAVAEIDGRVFGHPVASLNDIPKGEYVVQAFVNIYTRFDRADGHTVLITAVEERFRVIREPWARKLSGGSTGGWEALALQIFHPDFFGGAWASCPDSVDFRYHQIVNIYNDDNAYFLQRPWTKIERPNQRTPDGTITSMMKDENWFELVSGDRSRSGGQWDIWEATYSPVGPDGYPTPIWNKKTGTIDKQVAAYWKEHYDLRAILERDWNTLGPRLVGKLHIYVGDDDSFYLDAAVELMEKFLESTKTPYYAGSVTYKRGAPHCYSPAAKDLLDAMTQHIERTAPVGTDITSWRYK